MMEKNTYRILIVDDSRFVRLSLRQVFNKISECNFDLVEADNGREALDILADDESIELVITDMTMPVMDGLELIQRIREQERYETLPVLILTSIDDEAAKVRAFALGVTDYVTKPFLVPELQSRTLGYLERQRAFHALVEEIHARKFAEEALQDSFHTIKNQQAQMDEDLKMAEEVQKQLFTNYQSAAYLKIVTRYLPHSHVSGDIYHLKENDDGDYDLFLGDATGHGAAAALTTIMAKMALDEKIEDPSLVPNMFRLNRIFEDRIPEDRFLSAIYARLKANGLLTTVNAGHPPLIVIPQDGGDPVQLKEQGTLLGILPSEFIEYEESSYQMNPGDRGFLYTDGFTERTDLEENLFGIDRLADFLHQNQNEDLDTLLTKLLDHMEEFACGTPPDDDVTIVAFEYIGSSDKSE